MDWIAVLADPAATGIVVGVLALILFGAAWHKFAEPNAFLSALAGYRLLPEVVLGPATRAVPAIETVLGLGLLLPVTRGVALMGTAGLMLLYALSMAVNLMRGRDYIDCGCGGAAHPLSWGLVMRNIILAGAAIAVSGPGTERNFDWTDAITLVFGVLAFYAAYLAADELMRQASRMARTHNGGSPS
ncbi:MAG: MauE/DoxX family redox-associated membrane protein [Burkholderiales bacterium]